MTTPINSPATNLLDEYDLGEHEEFATLVSEHAQVSVRTRCVWNREQRVVSYTEQVQLTQVQLHAEPTGVHLVTYVERDSGEKVYLDMAHERMDGSIPAFRAS